MKQNWIKNIVGGLSFTSALFVFQACYGTPQDFGMDLLLEGQVKSKTTGLPIKGIKITVNENNQYDYTNNEGKFSFYTQKLNTLQLIFEDIDSVQNGIFERKDSTLTNLASHQTYVEVELVEK